MKKDVHVLHRKFVLAHEDEAANNVSFVCTKNYIISQELGSAKIYEHNLNGEKSVVERQR